MDSSASSDLGAFIAWHDIEEESSFVWQALPVHTICDRGTSAINMLATRATIFGLTPTFNSHSIVTITFQRSPRYPSKFTELHACVSVCWGTGLIPHRWGGGQLARSLTPWRDLPP